MKCFTNFNKIVAYFQVALMQVFFYKSSVLNLFAIYCKYYIICLFYFILPAFSICLFLYFSHVVFLNFFCLFVRVIKKFVLKNLIFFPIVTSHLCVSTYKTWRFNVLKAKGFYIFFSSLSLCLSHSMSFSLQTIYDYDYYFISIFTIAYVEMWIVNVYAGFTRQKKIFEQNHKKTYT